MTLPRQRPDEEAKTLTGRLQRGAERPVLPAPSEHDLVLLAAPDEAIRLLIPLVGPLDGLPDAVLPQIPPTSDAPRRGRPRPVGTSDHSSDGLVPRVVDVLVPVLPDGREVRIEGVALRPLGLPSPSGLPGLLCLLPSHLVLPRGPYRHPHCFAFACVCCQFFCFVDQLQKVCCADALPALDHLGQAGAVLVAPLCLRQRLNLTALPRPEATCSRAQVLGGSERAVEEGGCCVVEQRPVAPGGCHHARLVVGASEVDRPASHQQGRVRVGHVRDDELKRVVVESPLLVGDAEGLLGLEQRVGNSSPS